MARFLATRFVTYVILAFLATSLAYFLSANFMHPEEVLYPPIATQPVPHDTAVAYLNQRNVNPEVPVVQRYANWLNDLVHGSLGYTSGTNKEFRPILDVMKERVPISLRLVVLGAAIGTVLGITVGAYTAVRRNGVLDRFITLFSFIILSLPTVVVILIVQQLNQAITDATGYGLPAINPVNPLLEPGSWEDIAYQAQALVMPTIVLSLFGLASYSRYMKVTTLDVLGSDYLRTARAKGLNRPAAMRKHGLRMALIPMGQYLAFAVGGAFAGSLFIERMFNWQGIGSFSISAISLADINSTVAIVLYSAILTLVSATFADFLQGLLDPRIR